jgi:D-arabinose 1-dehydrogenase-like Zn-dependent alcohol dehydrogenase
VKAAVVHAFGQPPVIEEIPTSEPGPGQIVVKIETSGLCHTDIHAKNGDWPVKPSLPFTPGHEAVGLVAGVGSGVTRLHEGDRVAVPWLGWACEAKTVVKGIKVVGSFVGTRVDLAETFEFQADRRTRVVQEARQLEQVNEAIEEVLKGEVEARLVFDLR